MCGLSEEEVEDLDLKSRLTAARRLRDAATSGACECHRPPRKGQTHKGTGSCEREAGLEQSELSPIPVRCRGRGSAVAGGGC